MRKVIETAARRGGKMQATKKAAFQAVMRGETVALVRADGDTVILRPTEKRIPEEPRKLEAPDAD